MKNVIAQTKTREHRCDTDATGPRLTSRDAAISFMVLSVLSIFSLRKHHL